MISYEYARAGLSLTVLKHLLIEKFQDDCGYHRDLPVAFTEIKGLISESCLILALGQ